MTPDLPPPPNVLTPNEPEVKDQPETSNPDPEVTEQDTTEQVGPNLSQPENVDYVGPQTMVSQDFTYPTHTDPMRANTSPGIYLDDVEREKAEITRAKLEGREPDLDNPPSTQGTPLLPTHTVRASLPGDVVVEPDVSLEVSVGVPDSNLHNYGEAQQEREVAEAHGVER